MKRFYPFAVLLFLVLISGPCAPKRLGAYRSQVE